MSFDAWLAQTVQWYRDNTDWTRRVMSGEYRDYYRKNYGWRDSAAAVAR
jgi:dTDP-glucose 4,6-dehydratase